MLQDMPMPGAPPACAVLAHFLPRRLHGRIGSPRSVNLMRGRPAHAGEHSPGIPYVSMYKGRKA